MSLLSTYSPLSLPIHTHTRKKKRKAKGRDTYHTFLGHPEGPIHCNTRRTRAQFLGFQQDKRGTGGGDQRMKRREEKEPGGYRWKDRETEGKGSTERLSGGGEGGYFLLCLLLILLHNTATTTTAFTIHPFFLCVSFLFLLFLFFPVLQLPILFLQLLYFSSSSSYSLSSLETTIAIKSIAFTTTLISFSSFSTF